MDGNQVLAIWFTYPSDSDPQESAQAWILGLGSYENDVITIVDAYKASGPVFGDGYDKDALVTKTWGDITITFTGPDSASMEYTGIDGNGGTDLTRLTGIVSDDQQGDLPTGISGAWYDPDPNGQGWFVEMISASQALVYWFTYDENGNQAWNLAVGNVISNTIVFENSLVLC